MKKIALLLILVSQLAQAKFTESQKDSCLKFLSYTSVSFGVNIRFYDTDYEKLPVYPFKDKTEAQVMAEMKGDFKDASAYKHLCFERFEQKDYATAEKHYVKALELYNQWLNSDQISAQTMQELYDLFYGVNQYQYISEVIEIAEAKFPNDLKLLQSFCVFAFNIEKDFNKAKAYLDRAFAISPNNITNITYQIMIPYYEHLTKLNQTGECGSLPDYDFLKKYIDNNKGQLAYEHLHHYAVGMKAYLLLTCEFLKSYRSDKKANMFKPKNSIINKDLEKSSQFFKKALKTNHPNKANLYNSLGTILLFQQKNKEAYDVFKQCYAEHKNLESLEAMILINALEDKPKFELLEQDFNLFVKQSQDTNTYSGLVSILMKHKMETKAKQYVELVEKSKNLNENGIKLLNTWNLEKRDFKRADYYVDFFDKESESYLWRKMISAVLKDDEGEAKLWFEKLNLKDPNEEDLLAFKKLVGF
ncbi:MAG: tetratricopeptide repeat protein [Cytophagales bacterium]